MISFLCLILSFHMDTYILFLSPIKQRSPVCSGFMFPSTLSPHPVTQPPSAPWPEVLAPSVDPFPLNDTPPPLPAKKHRRQRQQQEQQVTRHWCSESETLTLTAVTDMESFLPLFQRYFVKETSTYSFGGFSFYLVGFCSYDFFKDL